MNEISLVRMKVAPEGKNSKSPPFLTASCKIKVINASRQMENINCENNTRSTGMETVEQNIRLHVWMKHIPLYAFVNFTSY